MRRVPEDLSKDLILQNVERESMEKVEMYLLSFNEAVLVLAGSFIESTLCGKWTEYKLNSDAKSAHFKETWLDKKY